MTPEFYANLTEKLMLKLTGPTQAYLLQVKGRDIGAAFSHRHESITYPSAERQLEEITINKMVPTTSEAWEELMNEFLQVNKEKLEMMSRYRQHAYEKGTLKL
jgi:hypothetical protein